MSITKWQTRDYLDIVFLLEVSQKNLPPELKFSRILTKAAKGKLEIVASLSEAQTAKEPGRKIFVEMRDRICAGEAGGILAWHPDKLARNSIDGGKEYGQGLRHLVISTILGQKT